MRSLRFTCAPTLIMPSERGTVVVQENGGSDVRDMYYYGTGSVLDSGIWFGTDVWSAGCIE